MDRRLFLALLLTAGAIILGTVMFPAPKRVPAPAAAARVDSTRIADPARPAATGTAGQDPALASGAAPVATAPLVPRADTAAIAAVRAETASVQTPLAVYRFASIGAVPISASMKKYETLPEDPGSGSNPVELARTGDPLLRYRLVVPGDTVDLSRTPFALTRTAAGVGGAERLSFTGAPADLPQARVTIAYDITPDSANGYLVRASGRVDGVPSPAYLLIDLPSGLRSAEADTVEDQSHLAFAYKPRADDAQGIGFGSLDPGERVLAEGPLTWVVSKNKYFIVALLKDSAQAPFAQLEVLGGARTSKRALVAHATAVEPIRDGAFGFELYMGPQEWRRMVRMGRDFENANPYGGWFQGVVQPFATIVMQILLWMKETTKLHYGWVLIVFGVAIRLILWPLNQKAMRASLKMQAVQPELQAVQQKYKNDPQKMQAEIMRVYKSHDMSPFSTLAGCLPALIPMPVLFALFFVFRNTIEFRGVPFMWLPDISLHDPLYILPVVMGLSMFVLSWIGMRGAPIGNNPQMLMQQRMMMYMFPVIMTVSLWKFASGLNLYYTVQNLAALPQQWLIAREREKFAPKAAAPGTASKPPAEPKRLKEKKAKA